MRTRKGGSLSSFAKSVGKSVKSVGRSVGLYKAHHVAHEPKSEPKFPQELVFPHHADIDAWKKFVRGFDWRKLNDDINLSFVRQQIMQNMPDKVFKTMFDKDMLLLPESKPASKPASKKGWWSWKKTRSDAQKNSPHKTRSYEDLDAYGKLDVWREHTGGRRRKRRKF
jgi:hypothetical protein